MSKLRLRNALSVLILAWPIAVRADVTGTPTLQSGSTINLDTGATGTSGGDLLWNGTTLTPQQPSTAVDVTNIIGAVSGASYYGTISSGTISTLVTEGDSSFLSANPLTPGVNDILAVLTSNGDYAKVLVTAINGTSITLEFDTFAPASSTPPPGAPNITSLQNNYGNVLPGLPSYGIAPGSLFIIYGTGLSANVTPTLQSSAAPGLPQKLNNTSISVTVGATTTTPAIYYTSPTQVAAVLPSTTPVGAGTITVTYNGVASATAPILVTKSAFGIDTLYGTGSGGIVATSGSNDILPTASASPGETITIWGSGVGADTANNDTTFPLKQDNLQSTYNVQVYIGGVAATVLYAGRSQYPGVDQVNVTVPSVASGLLTGCSVSVVVVANGVSSNFGTLPINTGGGVCSDPDLGITGTEIGQSGAVTTYKSGSVSLIQSTSPAGLPASRWRKLAQGSTSYIATADFSSETGASYISGSSFFSVGSCIVSQDNTSSTSTGTSTGLDAGTPITLTGGGLSVPLTEAVTGSYDAFPSTLTAGTAYTFTGPGGSGANAVGPFKVTITFPVPLTWTNSSITSVTESQGQLITWTGGAAGTLVFISGSSSGTGASATFTCVAPVADQQFTIPSYVLQALPKSSSGGLGLFNFSSRVSFTATGIDSGTASAGVLNEINVTYQ